MTRKKHFLFAFLATVLSCILHALPDPNDAFFEKENLFEVDDTYKSIRIPCILALPDNTVLAITSARSVPSDWAVIRLLMRRSTDGGKTWAAPVVLVEDGRNVVDNPVAIWDAQTKVVHFLYQTNYERVWHMQSSDSGKTFGRPVEITRQLAAFHKYYKWNVIAPGPGHGIQMKNGRIVVPVWLCIGALNKSGHGRSHRPSVTSVIYSDDNGKTWQCGDILPDTFKNMNETVAVEADDGGVWLYIRNEDPAYRKAIAYSKDGATNWTALKLAPELYTPICFASVLRISGMPDRSRILFCNPNSPAKTKAQVKWGGRTRENLTVRLSYDEGKTWPVSKVIEPGRSSYSDMTLLPDGTILCMYEHGFNPDNIYNTRYMTVARFNLEWLTDAGDSLGK
jgi:sialidase-1